MDSRLRVHRRLRPPRPDVGSLGTYSAIPRLIPRRKFYDKNSPAAEPGNFEFGSHIIINIQLYCAKNQKIIQDCPGAKRNGSLGHESHQVSDTLPVVHPHAAILPDAIVTVSCHSPVREPKCTNFEFESFASGFVEQRSTRIHSVIHERALENSTKMIIS